MNIPPIEVSIKNNIGVILGIIKPNPVPEFLINKLHNLIKVRNPKQILLIKYIKVIILGIKFNIASLFPAVKIKTKIYNKIKYFPMVLNEIFLFIFEYWLINLCIANLLYDFTLSTLPLALLTQLSSTFSSESNKHDMDTLDLFPNNNKHDKITINLNCNEAIVRFIG